MLSAPRKEPRSRRQSKQHALPPPFNTKQKKETKAQIQCFRAKPGGIINKSNTEEVYASVVKAHQRNVLSKLHEGLGVTARTLLPELDLHAALSGVFASSDTTYKVKRRVLNHGLAFSTLD